MEAIIVVEVGVGLYLEVVLEGKHIASDRQGLQGEVGTLSSTRVCDVRVSNLFRLIGFVSICVVPVRITEVKPMYPMQSVQCQTIHQEVSLIV